MGAGGGWRGGSLIECAGGSSAEGVRSHDSLVEKQGCRGSGRGYKKPLKASRSKAVSRRRCSSVTCVFLLPVAGAAAGSRPAYLRAEPGEMRRTGPLGGQPAPGASPHGLGAADGGAQPRLHVVVVALVLVLLLAPHQIGVGVLLHFPQQQVKGEGRELRRDAAASAPRAGAGPGAPGTTSTRSRNLQARTQLETARAHGTRLALRHPVWSLALEMVSRALQADL